MTKIVLNNRQKEYVANTLMTDHADYNFDKEYWVITDDKSYDEIRNESDDKAFPWCLLINNKFYDALSDDFVDEIVENA